MKIKDVLEIKGSKVWTIDEGQSIYNALQILVTQRIGALLVFDKKSKIAGIISERDVVRGSYRNGGSLGNLQVRDLMTKQVYTAAPEDDISAVMLLMTDQRVRHIPVVGENGLAGLVSIGDIVKALLQDSEYQIRHLKEYIYGSNSE